jgi:carbon storage regulator
MLVLTRREGESLLLFNERTGERVEITLLEINGTTVKVGTTAPDNITILRTELLENKVEPQEAGK